MVAKSGRWSLIGQLKSSAGADWRESSYVWQHCHVRSLFPVHRNKTGRWSKETAIMKARWIASGFDDEAWMKASLWLATFLSVIHSRWTGPLINSDVNKTVNTKKKQQIYRTLNFKKKKQQILKDAWLTRCKLVKASKYSGSSIYFVNQSVMKFQMIEEYIRTWNIVNIVPQWRLPR